ncbi:MAG: hypothetical protein BWY07_01150 [Candidatus Hydrogenedentes bacterium ADurb.Bin170]|jgi:hypothetical protein|nr:MAG: hypothetical protein BWY07_01150 [Candidatus Hydrogenedentes bacterium ADurb.Bin170]
MFKSSRNDTLDFFYDLFDLLNFIIEIFRNLGNLFSRR